MRSTWRPAPISATADCPASRPACSDLDEKMGGLQSSDLIILAGRPAMGKTALATNIAYNVAKAYKAEHLADGSVKVMDGGVVAFFSLEMSSEQLATRIISEQAMIPSERIRRGKITEDEFATHRRSVARDAVAAALHRRHRRPHHRAGGGARPAAEAPARAGPRSSSTTSSCSPAPRAAPPKAACRRSPRSPSASRRWPRN